VQARLEKVAAKEPEFAHLLAEVAEHVLSSFGRLLASPNAARHVHDVLFYYFEGYETRDGELLFARIERTVREAVRRAEEAGIPDAEYRIKQFILEVIDVLARAGERYRRDALKAVSTVEKALRATALRWALRHGAVLRVPRAVFRGRGFVGGLRCGACGGGPLQGGR
jgi:nucleotide-binding universal stress UspA family protein